MEYEYYSNGVLNYKRRWRDNKPYGDVFWFLKNGKLSSYAVDDITGKRFTLYSYDKNGQIDKMIGFVFSFNIFSVNYKTDSIVVLNYGPKQLNNKFHDIGDLYITTATPPGLTLKLEVEINNQVFDNLKAIDNTVRIPNAFPAKGRYSIFISSHLLDNNSQVINGINEKTTIENY